MSLEGPTVLIDMIINTEHDNHETYMIHKFMNKYICIHSDEIKNLPSLWIEPVSAAVDNLNQELILYIIGLKIGRDGFMYMLAELILPKIDNTRLVIDPNYLTEAVIINPRFSTMDIE